MTPPLGIGLVGALFVAFLVVAIAVLVLSARGRR